MKFRAVGWGAKERFYIDDREVTKEEFDAALPSMVDEGGTGDSFCGFAPLASDALAVHPAQIPEVMERNRRHGLYTEYDGEGRPILKSRDERRRLMRVEGCHDNNGGYGDG